MRYFVGVDVGGTKIEAALVSSEGAVLKTVKMNTDAGKGKETVIRNIEKAIEKVSSEKISGIGIGLPGPFEPKKGVLLQSPKIPCLIGVPVKKILKDKFGVNVTADNDARFFVLGEHKFGAGKGKDNVVGITLGTGIGGAVIINGTIEKNPGTTKKEIGHITLVKNGRKCSCGAKGCFEAYSSGTPIAERYKKLTGLEISTKEIAGNAGKGDRTAKKVISEAGAYLGKGLARIIDRYNPEVIVIGGSVSNTKELLETGKKELKRLKPESNVRIVKSRLKNAGILGAVSGFLKD